MISRFGSARDTVDPLDVVVANLPLLLLVGGLSATLLAIAAVVGVLVLMSAALFSFPELVFFGTTFDGAWALFRFGPLLVLHGGLAGAVAYGIWMERMWTRRVAVGFWAAIIVSASVAAILHPVGGRFWFFVALWGLPVFVATWLYLYLWAPVKAYYEDNMNTKKAPVCEKA